MLWKKGDESLSDSSLYGMAGQALGRPNRSSAYPWYDSVWLEEYTKAKAIIRKIKPDALTAFESAFQIFQTRNDFQEKVLERVFDDNTLDEIRRVVKSLRPSDIEMHEAQSFKRFVVHDNPFFNELQKQITPLVSAAAGEPVETSYNFLSLYSAMGVCPVHMDSPEAKWTLDICLDQSVGWPIYFSRPHTWAEIEAQNWSGENWAEVIKSSPTADFKSYILEPGQAILFSGASQWHYRDPMPKTDGRATCDLLFFHFIPQGTSELVNPRNWAGFFGIPDLESAVKASPEMPHG